MNVEDIVYATFRRNLQILRTASGLSAEDLSDKIGAKSKKRITDLEYGEVGRGIPKIDEVVELAKIFNVSIDDMLTKKAVIKFDTNN